MSKIMVLGAGGYIGIPLVKELLENDYEVVCLDRFFFGENLLLNQREMLHHFCQSFPNHIS